MATNNQIQFVSDIEAGARHLNHQGHNPSNPTKISRVFEAAGRSQVELKPIANSLRNKREWPLVERLRFAFESVGVLPKAMQEIYNPPEEKPIYIVPEEVNEDTAEEELKLEPVIPVYFEPIARPEMTESLTSIIKILEPMNQRQRQRIVNSVSVYFEVGE